MKVAVIGGQGFVGSAFVRHLTALSGTGLVVSTVTRSNYQHHTGQHHDIVIHCAGNSRKYLAEQQPLDEFDASVGLIVRTLRDYPARLHILISSVDVYADLSQPKTTNENCTWHGVASSHYGFHKWLAEEVVRHHAASWLIFRLAGMVGPGLKKNPVFDLINRRPLHIHPDSRYQYLQTGEVAELCWKIVTLGVRNEVFNVCGTGTVSIREIAALVGTEPDLSQLYVHTEPRIVDIDCCKLRRIHPVPETRDSLTSFIGR